MHAIMLEVGTHRAAVDTYCNQVIACLSDQGGLRVTVGSRCPLPTRYGALTERDAADAAGRFERR